MSSEDRIPAIQRRLDALRSQHGPTHPDVIQQQMDLAELTGQQGDFRSATDFYQSLGDNLRAHFGPHHSRSLDAYEGFVRWIEAEGRA